MDHYNLPALLIKKIDLCYCTALGKRPGTTERFRWNSKGGDSHKTHIRLIQDCSVGLI